MKALNLSIPFILLSCSTEIEQEPTATDHTYRDQAYSFLEKNNADSAFFYFNLAGEQYQESKDSLNAANCLIQMAIILSDKGDYFGSQETSFQANAYLDEANPDHHYYLSSNFNSLGISTQRLKDYEHALEFYETAIRFSTDSASTQLYLNNKAKTLQQKKDYAAALEIYKKIIDENTENPRAYARALTNFAVTQWAANPSYDALPDLWRSLHIRQRENDLWGQNSSYTHLADYYTNKQPDSALYYAHRRYAVARTLRSGDDLAHALQKLIQLETSDSVKHYFNTYQQLIDSIQLARSAAKNQFALIRYGVEKNKADNLKLQQENAEKVYQINRQRIITIVILLIAIIFSVGGIYSYKKRRQRIELESQNRIKAYQLRTSKKIHDVVANGIYRVMAKLENQDIIDREAMLDQLEDMYEKSRDISYETADLPNVQYNFHERLAQLLTSFATNSTKVIIAGNDPDLWDGVLPEARQELLHILQELMVNMRKHSQASHVAVRLARQDGQLLVYYTDNGVGLPEDIEYGKGLTNAGNRIKSLQGVITFNNTAKTGLKIQITLPII
ncbi:ATP-binding protein [Parapedobacter deserti]|uniref:histidine kinase n=1 Tax=Parapedobacter deserti TaxID=1912957 RepID=A0ABV7JW07_9SPHI